MQETLGGREDNMHYDFVDFMYHDWVDPICKGPRYSFNINDNTLEVVVSGDGTYVTPDPPANRKEALDILNSRLDDLKEETEKLTEFLQCASSTTRYAK